MMNLVSEFPNEDKNCQLSSCKIPTEFKNYLFYEHYKFLKKKQADILPTYRK